MTNCHPWSHHVTNFIFLVPLKISEMAKAEHLILYTDCPYGILALGVRMTNCPSNGRDHTEGIIVKFRDLSYNSGIAEVTVVKFCVHIGHIKLVILG